MNPYLDARAAESGDSVDIGVEANPKSLGTFGGRWTVLLKKTGALLPSDEPADHWSFGLGAFVFNEFGRGVRVSRSKMRSDEISIFGIGLEGQWSLARYTFRPKAGPERFSLEHSWKIQLSGWWYTNASTPEFIEPDSRSGETDSRAQLKRISRSAWILAPQVQLRYERYASEADDSFVVLAPEDNGLTLAEKMKLTPPVTVPSASLLIAVPFSPPSGDLAFGPAVRFTTWGQDNEWQPFLKVGRIRLESWLYYFPIEEGPHIRISAAPFLDVRLFGVENRNQVGGGAMLELRASTTVLEY